MADIAPTLNLIDSAIGQDNAPAAGVTPGGVPVGSNGLPRVTISPPDKSPADKAIDVLQAGIDRKLPEPTKPYETTGKSMVLNAESGANSALASTLGAPVDLVNAGLRKVGLPVSDKPFGGSESIKSAMGLIQANPDNVVPQNEAERIAHGMGEGAGSAVLLPLGGEALAAGKVISPQIAQTVRAGLGAPDALNAGIGAASGAGSTVASDVVPEPYKPIAAVAGGLVGGLPVLAGHTAAEGARAALEGLKNHVTEEGAKRAVAKEMAAAATDQAAARENLAKNPAEVVPGSVGTTGQVAGDTGLLNWERGVRQNNAPEFNNREAEQNSARIQHLESVQPTGNAADLPGVIQSQRDAAARTAEANTGVVDTLSGASVKNAETAQKSAVEGLKTLGPEASPAEVSAHFRNVRDALEADHETQMAAVAKKAEDARLASAPNASSPEQVGQNLREPAQEARNSAKENENTLWKAVDPDGTLAVSMGPVQEAKKAIYGGLTKAGEADLSPVERSLTGVIDEYKPVESFRELTDLRSSVSTAMRKELKESGRTQAYGRMSQLRSGIENAIDNAVENRAVQEQGAVARGAIPEESAIAGRIKNWVDEFRSRRSSEVSQGDGGSATSSGTAGAVGVPGSKGQASDGLRGAEGNQASPEPNFDESARERLNAASEATKARATTFDEGAPGKLLKPGTRAGEYKLSDAKAAAAIFHPGDTGGEDVRAYVKAVGPEKANTALSDAAAASLHEKATRPDGTLDPKKVDAWLSAHKTAIGELPPGTRTKFENAANAQRAVEDAMAARRDALTAHDKSEAGKLMGLKDSGDVVREVGSVISSKDGAKRMGELADAAKDNPAAKEGLQRAVVEHVMNKFLPDNLEKAQSFIKDKADVLGKVFTPEQIDGISKKIEVAQTSTAKLESAKANRDVALKEAQASEKEALSRYDQTILGKIMKTEGTANVLDKIGTVFGSSDSAKQMSLLADEAAKVQGGTEALRKAVTEMIRRDYSGSAEVGTSGEKGISRGALDKFMKENTETLEKVLSPEQVGKLKAIVDDQLRANRSITATKLKGGSDTNQNQITSKGGSILSLLAKQATEVGGTIIGSVLGGPGGAVVGNIGAKASAALRDAGLNRLNEIRIRAALDPQFGKALLDEVPKYPDRNAAALIALRARQLSVAGAAAGARQ